MAMQMMTAIMMTDAFLNSGIFTEPCRNMPWVNFSPSAML